MKTSEFIVLLSAALAVAAGPALAASASDLWSADCARCHGPDGAGHTLLGRRLHVKDKTDRNVQAEQTDLAMSAVIKDGIEADGKNLGPGHDLRLRFVTSTGVWITIHLKARMAPFRDELSDTEIHGLVTCIRAMKK